jgi:hypothetical protein
MRTFFYCYQYYRRQGLSRTRACQRAARVAATGF